MHAASTFQALPPDSTWYAKDDSFTGTDAPSGHRLREKMLRPGSRMLAHHWSHPSERSGAARPSCDTQSRARSTGADR
jgi:hypothetical protein